MLTTQASGIKLRSHRLEEKAVEKWSPPRSPVCGWHLGGSRFLPPFLLCLVRACAWVQRAPLGRAGLEEVEVSDKAAHSMASFPPQPT